MKIIVMNTKRIRVPTSMNTIAMLTPTIPIPILIPTRGRWIWPA
ncbi:hypothetical protein [Treponema sp. TIM-1]